MESCSIVSVLTGNTNEEIQFPNNGENKVLKCLHNELLYLAILVLITWTLQNTYTPLKDQTLARLAPVIARN